jgi:hypothetical protein
MVALRTLFAATALSLVACTSVASSAGTQGNATAIADGSTFDMHPGQTVTLADASTLRYDSLVNDSRCMPDVQCVWAGDAEVAFTWRSSGGGRDAFSLHTGRGDKSHMVGDRTVTLVALARGSMPAATLKVGAGG